VLQARDRARDANKGIDIKYMVPKEGSILWFDMLAIPKDAPDPDSAYAYMNYIMTPQVSADISNFKRYANANTPAQPLVQPAVKDDPGFIPPPSCAEALGAAGGLARADARHHAHVAKIQDGPISGCATSGRSRCVKAAPWKDPAPVPMSKSIASPSRSAISRRSTMSVLKIYKGEIFCLLGASGCGKTTLLRMLGGFETPTSGRIFIDGEDMTGVPPYERPVNMMFQSYALFPHMTWNRTWPSA
jgi:hypothetical protein